MNVAEHFDINNKVQGMIIRGTQMRPEAATAERSKASQNEEEKSGAERLPDLTGKTAEEAAKTLGDTGFVHKGETEGGYDKWYHPDGSRVQIRPNGEVVRTAPKETPAGGGKKIRPRVDQSGKRTDSHNTGETIKQ